MALSELAAEERRSVSSLGILPRTLRHRIVPASECHTYLSHLQSVLGLHGLVARRGYVAWPSINMDSYAQGDFEIMVWTFEATARHTVLFAICCAAWILGSIGLNICIRGSSFSKLRPSFTSHCCNSTLPNIFIGPSPSSIVAIRLTAKLTLVSDLHSYIRKWPILR